MLVRELTKEMNQAVKNKIMEQVGKPVIFDCGLDEKHLQGKLLDRIVMHANPEEPDRVPCWDVVDLIQFGEKRWLRFGYYRMPKDHLLWCAQTTLTEPLETLKGLLIKAARKKSWFREFLEDILQEAREPLVGHGLHDNVMVS